MPPEVVNAIEEQRLMALGRAERAKTEPPVTGDKLRKRADLVQANRIAAAKLEHAIICGVLNPQAVKAIRAETQRLQLQGSKGLSVLSSLQSYPPASTAGGLGHEEYSKRLQTEIGTWKQHVAVLKRVAGSPRAAKPRKSKRKAKPGRKR